MAIDSFVGSCLKLTAVVLIKKNRPAGTTYTILLPLAHNWFPVLVQQEIQPVVSSKLFHQIVYAGFPSHNDTDTSV